MQKSDTEIAAMSWAEQMDYEDTLEAARQKEEEHLEAECLFFEPAKSLTKDLELKPVQTADSAVELAKDDPQRADQWYSLGSLIWGTQVQTWSRGELPEIPLPGT